MDQSAVPTPERLAKAQGDVSIGDDKQGRKRYTFYDSALDRVYGPLVRAATTQTKPTACVSNMRRWPIITGFTSRAA